MIPYTNMAPYRELGPPSGCRFVSCVPSESVKALQKGIALAAAVPVGGLSVLKGMVVPAGNFGIAAKEKSLSVLFFSDRPFWEIKAPDRVYITDESVSSVRLLYLLLGYQQGFDGIPYVSGEIEKANGELIIGDKALRKMRLKQGMPSNKRFGLPDSGFNYVTDMASEWYAVHNLPFVFARWVIRKDAPKKMLKALEDWLAEFKERENELVKNAVPNAAENLGVPHEDIEAYFHVIRRTLNDEDLAGQELFLQELEKYKREPLFFMNKRGTNQL